MRALTRREQEVHRLYVMGYSGRRMAFELGISPKTVKNHVSSIIRKTKGSAPPPRITIAPDPLTPREVEVIRLIARGHSNQRAAKELGVKQETVKFHLTHVLRKLGVQSRTEAAWRALEMGIVEAPIRITTSNRSGWWQPYHWNRGNR